MLALLQKDFITSRKSVIIMNIIAVCILGGFLYFGCPFEIVSMLYIIATIVIPLMSNKLIATEEGRRNYDMIMNSFPISRKAIVISKNLFYLLIYIITSVFLLSIISIMGKPASENLSFIFLIQSLSFIYYTLIIGIPNYMYYKFDYDVVVKYGVVVFLSIIYVPMIFFHVIEKAFPNAGEKIMSIVGVGSAPKTLITIAMFCVGILIYAIFTILSIKGYCSKDLS